VTRDSLFSVTGPHRVADLVHRVGDRLLLLIVAVSLSFGLIPAVPEEALPDLVLESGGTMPAESPPEADARPPDRLRPGD
jgi:hypothetical protein